VHHGGHHHPDPKKKTSASDNFAASMAAQEKKQKKHHSSPVVAKAPSATKPATKTSNQDQMNEVTTSKGVACIQKSGASFDVLSWDDNF
jgi:hypothetical protein